MGLLYFYTDFVQINGSRGADPRLPRDYVHTCIPINARRNMKYEGDGEKATTARRSEYD